MNISEQPDGVSGYNPPTGPLVSIIMPTYKRQEYFKLALESAIKQSYTNLEILVGDNENSAQTAAIVADTGDSRVQYLGRVDNLGMVMNNLSMFRQARGKYFVNLHDDDLLHPDFVAKMVQILEQDDSISIAFSDYFVIDSKGEIDLLLTESTMRDHKRDVISVGKHQPAFRVALLDRAVPTTLCGLIRRSVMNFDYFPLEVGNVYDLWLAYLAVVTGHGVYYCRERLAYRRVHAEADSSWSFIKLNQNAAFCYKHFLTDVRLHSLFPEFRRLVGTCQTRLGTMLLERGEAVKARPHLLDGFRHKPGPRALIGLLISWLPGGQTSGLVHRIQQALAWTRRWRQPNKQQPKPQQLQEH